MTVRGRPSEQAAEAGGANTDSLALLESIADFGDRRSYTHASLFDRCAHRAPADLQSSSNVVVRDLTKTAFAYREQCSAPALWSDRTTPAPVCR